MANVQFLKGNQTKLDSLQSFVPGSFYLTEDTERLYYAKGTSKNDLLYLNKYVVSVDNIQSLPALSSVNVGDLYYATFENVLCTKANANANSWTQINKNTNTETRAVGASLNKNATQSNSSQLVYDLVIDYKRFDVDTSSEIKDSASQSTAVLTIPVAEMLASGVQVGLEGEISNNNIQLSTAGAGANSSNNITIKPLGGISFGKDGDDLTIKSQTYTLSNDTTPAIELFDADNNSVGKVELEQGTDINYTGTTQGKIKINHKEYSYDSNSELSSNQTPEHKGSFNIITGLDVENGHIKKVKTGTVTLPEDIDTDTQVASVSADNSGKITIGLQDKNGTELDSIVSGQDLFYKINSNTVYNQDDLADYLVTKNELKALNAMVYKGTINSKEEFEAITSGSKGDTWLVNTPILVDIEYSENNFASKGDLLIVNGTENDEGIIESIEWDYVPSADETDTQYKMSLTNTTIELISENSQDVVSSIELAQDSNNPVVVENKDNSIVIKHKELTKNEIKTIKNQSTLSSSSATNLITGLTKDNYGHIVGYDVTPFVLPEDNDTTYHLASTSGKVALIDDSENTCGTISVEGGTSITVNKPDDNSSDSVFTVVHSNVSRTAGTSTPNVASGGNLTYIESVEVNDQGHVTRIVTGTAKFFEDTDTTYNLSGALSSSNNVHTFTVSLADENSNIDDAVLNISSDSLAISTSSATNTMTMNLVWGEF